MRKSDLYAGAAVVVFLASLAFALDTTSGRKKKLTLQDLLAATSGKSSKRPATVSGVRGLDESGGPIDTQARDFAAIDRMERVKVHEDELAKFTKEGHLK